MKIGHTTTIRTHSSKKCFSNCLVGAAGKKSHKFLSIKLPDISWGESDTSFSKNLLCQQKEVRVVMYLKTYFYIKNVWHLTSIVFLWSIRPHLLNITFQELPKPFSII